MREKDAAKVGDTLFDKLREPLLIFLFTNIWTDHASHGSSEILHEIKTWRAWQDWIEKKDEIESSSGS